MKKEHPSVVTLLSSRTLFGVVVCFSVSISLAASTWAQESGVEWGQSYHNDVSPALRDLPTLWPPKPLNEREFREANPNPLLPLIDHVDAPDPVVDHGALGGLVPEVMPPPILNFDVIPFPGVVCNCAPPDTNGAVGATQYVAIVNEGF